MYERMSIDQYAAYEADNGSRLLCEHGVWWQEVRPFFWRPLFPFQRLDPESARIPLHRRLIGYQHLVTDPRQANSSMNFIIVDELRDYTMDCLPTKIRWSIKSAARRSEVRPMADPDEFAEAGYPVYLSFYERTLYGWRRDRTDRAVFRQWVNMLYRHPRLKILGCYTHSQLNTVMISYLVENVVFYATLFCTDEGLRIHTSDLMLHLVREMAAQCPEAEYIFMGAPGARKSLDHFKIRRKCRILSEPARYRLNPLALFAVKRFASSHYRRLTGELVYPEDTPPGKRGLKAGRGGPAQAPAEGIFSRFGKPGRVYGSK